MHAKILSLVTGIIVGIVCGSVSVYGSEIAVAALVLLVTQCCLVALSIVHSRKKMNIQKEGRPSFLYCAPLTLCLSLGIVLGVIRVQFVEEKMSVICETVCTKSGYVVNPSTFAHEYQTIVFRSDETTSSYDILVRLPRYPTYEIGEQLTLSGQVRIPPPTFPHGSPQSFDYRSYLHARHLGSEMLYPRVTHREDVSGAQSLVQVLQSYKEKGRKIIQHYVTDPESSLATGVILGDDGMSSELKNTFRAAGVSHIVVLSGFNIAILVMFIFWITFFLPLILRVFFAIGMIILFVLAVGGEASLVRASLMMGVSLGALLLGRGYVARQALLVSLMVILLYAPETVLKDVSLHLSFLATAGIVYLLPVLEMLITPRIKKSFRSLLVTTLATYIATMPYIMYTFGSLSFYALIANILIVPLVPPLMLLSGLTILSGLFSEVLALLFGYGTSSLGHVIIVLAHVFEKMPFSHIEASISFRTMLVMYMLIGVSCIVTRNYRERTQKNETLRTNANESISEIMTY